MRILERYIIFSILKTYLATVLVFAFLFILGNLTGSLDEIIALKVPISILKEYYLLSLPAFFVQTSVFACLIAVLLTYGHMNQNNEVTVLRASGLNFWKITRPAIIFGLLISAVVFWTREHLVPISSIRAQEIQKNYLTTSTSEAEQKKSLKVIENMTFYGFDNRLFFIEKFDPVAQTALGIIIIQYDRNQNIKEKIIALEGIWTGTFWKFFQCQISTHESNEAGATTVRVKAYKERLMENIEEKPRDFLQQQISMSSVNIKQLKNYISRFHNSGASKAIQNLRVDLNEKIAFPFGNFVIVFVGLPFALMVRSRRRSIFTSLGVAIVISFFYFVINSVAIAFGKAGILPPILAAWIAPLLFVGIGIIAIESDFAN